MFYCSNRVEFRNLPSLFCPLLVGQCQPLLVGQCQPLLVGQCQWLQPASHCLAVVTLASIVATVKCDEINSSCGVWSQKYGCNWGELKQGPCSFGDGRTHQFRDSSKWWVMGCYTLLLCTQCSLSMDEWNDYYHFKKVFSQSCTYNWEIINIIHEYLQLSQIACMWCQNCQIHVWSTEGKPGQHILQKLILCHHSHPIICPSPNLFLGLKW